MSKRAAVPLGLTGGNHGHGDDDGDVWLDYCIRSLLPLLATRSISKHHTCAMCMCMQHHTLMWGPMRAWVVVGMGHMK